MRSAGYILSPTTVVAAAFVTATGPMCKLLLQMLEVSADSLAFVSIAGILRMQRTVASPGHG